MIIKTINWKISLQYQLYKKHDDFSNLKISGNSLSVQGLGLHVSTAGAQVPSLVGELRSRKSHGVARKKRRKNNQLLQFLLERLVGEFIILSSPSSSSSHLFISSPAVNALGYMLSQGWTTHSPAVMSAGCQHLIADSFSGELSVPVNRFAWRCPGNFAPLFPTSPWPTHSQRTDVGYKVQIPSF